MIEDDFIEEVINNNIPSNMQCDVYTQDDNYVIELDVPGYQKDNLKIEYSNGYLSVIGKRQDNKEVKDRKYIRKERIYGMYKRDFYVGKIDYTKVNANYKDGVLLIRFPKNSVDNTQNIIIK